MVSDSELNHKKGIGFAGLDSLVSDVSADVEKPAKSVQPKAPQSSVNDSPPSAASSPPQPPSRPDKEDSSLPSSQGKTGSSRIGWVIAGIVVLVIWFANSGDKTPSSAPYSPPPSSSVQPRTAVPAQPRTTAQAATPTPAPPPDIERPPVGRNQVLSIPQIRFCKKEKIRIEAFEGVINNSHGLEVDRFNGIVNDYNSRCGEYRYRRGDAERVQNELNLVSESLSQAAKSEWVRSSIGLEEPSNAQTTKSAKTPQKDKSSQAASRIASTSSESSTVDQKHSVGNLSGGEKESIESACSGQRILNGPAAYNQCLVKQLKQLIR